MSDDRASRQAALTAQIAAAYVRHNDMGQSTLPDLIAGISQSLDGLMVPRIAGMLVRRPRPFGIRKTWRSR